MKKTSSNSASMNIEDEIFFEKHLQHESSLSEQYQNIESPTPSDTLDQNILSIARKTSRETQKQATHWWQQPASWAASVAVFSLAALLSHQTWLAEQNISEQDFAPKDAIEAKQNSETLSLPSDSVVPNRTKEKMHRRLNDKNDSRKLLFKSAPAPIMPVLQERQSRHPLKTLPIETNQTQTQEIGMDEAEMDSIEITIQPLPLREKAVLTEKKEQVSRVHYSKANYSKAQSLLLDKIQLLIEQGRIDEAKELMQQFKLKYPEISISPVILQHLSPY